MYTVTLTTEQLQALRNLKELGTKLSTCSPWSVLIATRWLKNPNNKTSKIADGARAENIIINSADLHALAGLELDE